MAKTPKKPEARRDHRPEPKGPAPRSRSREPAPRAPAPPSAAATSVRRAVEPGHLFKPMRPAGEPSAEPEHRSFPRVEARVPFALSIGEAHAPRFSATLTSANLSVSGAFLESSFFLPIGTTLQVRFLLAPGEPEVEASAEIVRQEREDERSGFAVRFLEFYGQTEVTLARLFVGQRLREFASEYLASTRAASLESELERLVDALAAWELQKVTSGTDLWIER